MAIQLKSLLGEAPFSTSGKAQANKYWGWDQLYKKINSLPAPTPKWGKHFSLLFLPATP